MLLYKSLLFLLLSSLGRAEYYYIYGEDFLDFIGDSENFHVESYESISIYGIPPPTSGRHTESLYLTDENEPSYTPFTKLPSSKTVTLEFRFFCDDSNSELVLVVDYNHKLENILLCGSESDIADPGMWVTESITRNCIADDCTHIYISLFGMTNDAGDLVGLYSIGVTIEESGTTLVSTSTVAPTTSTASSSDPTTSTPKTTTQITSKSTSRTTTLPSCPTDDMIVIGGEAYKIIADDRINWYAAQDLCISLGLIMAEPKTNAKELAGYLWGNYGYRFSFGGRDMSGDNRFSWVSSGLPIPGDSPLWQPGVRPGEYCDAQDGDDCCIYSNTYTYPYWARSCGYDYCYTICQCP